MSELRREAQPPEPDFDGPPSPAEQLRGLLAAARHEGQGFEPAWRKARRALEMPPGRADRDAWALALAATREEWRDAYERRPSSPLDRIARAAA